MADNLDAFLLDGFDHAFGRDLTAKWRRAPVTTFIKRLRLNARDASFGHFFLQWNTDEIDGTASAHARFNRAEICFVGLCQIGSDRNNLDAIFSQPMGDGTAIKTAGCGKSNGLAFKIVHIHR